jgi:MFS family permease
MLSFVYWPTVAVPAREEAINIATLAGCVVGMILFGVLGDIYGRRKMYGIELIVLIVGNVGVLMSSNGFATGDGLNGSMDIESWLIFFRFVSGIGIGGNVSFPVMQKSRVNARVWVRLASSRTPSTIVSTSPTPSEKSPLTARPN